jgi:alpha-tubulin suppressor-like RCC1 family protein
MLDDERSADEVTEVKRLENLNIAQITTAEDYIVIVTEDSKVFWWGESVQKIRLSIDHKQEIQIPMGKVKMIKASKTNLALLMDNNLFYYRGANIHKNIDKKYFNEFTRIYLAEQSLSPLHFDVGSEHIIYTTTSNRVFVIGKKYLERFSAQQQLWEGSSEILIDHILLEEEFKEIDEIIPICSQAEENSEIVTYLLIKMQGKHKLYSHGESKTGKLGQGEIVKSSEAFILMDYNCKEINFIKVSAPYDFGMALADNGELYVWGENKYDQFGLGDEIIYSPERISMLDDYTVHDFSCGKSHALIQASPKNNPHDKKMILLDDKLKMKGDVDSTGICVLQKFEDKQIDSFVSSRF